MPNTIQSYLSDLKGKTVAVIGIGVSNTPLIKLLLRAGIKVTACDKARRADFGGPGGGAGELGSGSCAWGPIISRGSIRM